VANAVITTSVPYCTPTRLLDYVDWKIVADALKDDDDAPQLSKSTLLNASSAAGTLLTNLCLAASGTLEGACFAHNLYTVAELQSLTGATAKRLEQIVAGLTVWNLFGRRAPVAAKVDEIPAVRVAMDAMDRLGKGERIFGLTNQAVAGEGFEPITRQDVIDNGDRITVNAAYRYFGRRSPRTGVTCGE